MSNLTLLSPDGLHGVDSHAYAEPRAAASPHGYGLRRSYFFSKSRTRPCGKASTWWSSRPVILLLATSAFTIASSVACTVASKIGSSRSFGIVSTERVGFPGSAASRFAVDLQKRLGRKAESTNLFAAASADVPVVFVAFDLLLLNNRSLLKTTLRDRRELLRTLKLPPQFQIAKVSAAHTADEIDAAFSLARRRMNEGLMVKDPESYYVPGRRGMFWFKLKKELATLDVVVVAAELGHGKRNHVLSDYTFAVRDDATGELLPIGKAYSGLTDVEIAELTEHFKQNTIVDHGRYREVKPDTVLEVAFDSVQPSTRHASGLALRFPRIKAIRRDKNVDAIDTLSYARQLAEHRGKGEASTERPRARAKR